MALGTSAVSSDALEKIISVNSVFNSDFQRNKKSLEMPEMKKSLFQSSASRGVHVKRCDDSHSLSFDQFKPIAGSSAQGSKAAQVSGAGEWNPVTPTREGV